MGEVVDHHQLVTLGLEPVDQARPGTRPHRPPRPASIPPISRRSAQSNPGGAARRGGRYGEADPAEEGVGPDGAEVAAVGAGRPVVAQHQVLRRPEAELELARSTGAAGEVGLGDGLPVDLQPRRRPAAPAPPAAPPPA